MGLGHGRETPSPVYHCTILPQKHQAAEVPWTLWVLRMVCESTKKINKNTLSSWVRKPRGLGTSGCSGGEHTYLKSSVITELNEMLNTMNMASVLQGEDPPPLVYDINYIYKEVERGRIRMRKNWECKLGIHCKWWRKRQCVPEKIFNIKLIIV